MRGSFFGSLPREAPGRPRIYKNNKEADHAYYIRNRDRHRENRAISPKNGHVSGPLALARKHADVIGRALDPMKDMAVAIAETIVAAVPDTGVRVLSLKELLVKAAGGNVDREADVLSIRALLDRCCDLEADVLPTAPPRFPARATARPVLQRPR